MTWCPGCLTFCPGLDPAGFCLAADRAEIDARARRITDGDPARVAGPGVAASRPAGSGTAVAPAVVGHVPAAEAGRDACGASAGGVSNTPSKYLHRNRERNMYVHGEVWSHGLRLPPERLWCVLAPDSASPYLPEGGAQFLGEDGRFETRVGAVELRAAAARAPAPVRTRIDPRGQVALEWD